MQTFWIKRRGEPGLIVLLLGWAGEAAVAEDVVLDGYDTLAVYDYRLLEPIGPETTAPYRHVVLAAWSFGVWAAEQVCSRLPLHRAIALNGTPLPVDDRYGIPAKVFAVTQKGIRRAGLEQFDRRTYGTYYDRMAKKPHTRPLDELLDELRLLGEGATAPYRPSLRWDAALVGGGDLIFPPEHMAAYWRERGHRVADTPHYPFGDMEIIRKLITNDKKL